MTLEHIGTSFDRDETIDTELDFLRHPDEVELIPKAAQAIREANSPGHRVFVITNQSGVARELLTEADLADVHDRLRALLSGQGARIDAIDYCPHHLEFGRPPYNILCICRKPDIEMLTHAASEFNMQLQRSCLVGDRDVDTSAGKRAGCTTILVRTGYGETEEAECVAAGNVDFVADDASGAWQTVRNTLYHTISHSHAQ